ncbi:unnamed protein product [Prorocentrum cordatum]|uniref:RNA-directed RNA polymerase n=1 Tax=Prorocentrum cordatum TaxID=2364126 RepID=A0ABN9Q2I2_9DINO|nr:unnamed protein product [Polarella glacialis]
MATWGAALARAWDIASRAVSTRGGFEPAVRFAPGFGPFALAWGRRLVGVLGGLLIGTYFEQIANLAASLATGWEAELAAATGPRRAILLRLSDEGGAASDLLAAAGGVPRRGALASQLGPVGDDEFLRARLAVGFPERPVGSAMATLGFAERAGGAAAAGFATPLSRSPGPSPADPPAAEGLAIPLGERVCAAEGGGPPGPPQSEPLSPVGRRGAPRWRDPGTPIGGERSPQPGAWGRAAGAPPPVPAPPEAVVAGGAGPAAEGTMLPPGAGVVLSDMEPLLPALEAPPPPPTVGGERRARAARAGDGPPAMEPPPPALEALPRPPGATEFAGGAAGAGARAGAGAAGPAAGPPPSGPETRGARCACPWGAAAAAAAAAPLLPGAPGEVRDVHLPADWAYRIEQLPAQAMLHIPVPFQGSWSSLLVNSLRGVLSCCRRVRFAATSGPSPGGARPEHLKDLLTGRRWSAVNRLLRALGALIDGARWGVPAVAAGVRQHGGALVPGSAEEVLIHARRASGGVLQAGGHAPPAALDLDPRNAFPSLERDAIRAAVEEQAPNLLAWAEWRQADSIGVRLPCGELQHVDRGAGQGDPLGGAQCSPVLAKVAAEARAAVEAAGGWVFEARHMGDGQVVPPAWRADIFLRAVDAAAERALGDAGASRGTECARRTCKTPVSQAPARVLGASIGAGAVATPLSERTVGAAAARAALAPAGGARAELALARARLHACKAAHLARAAGPEIPVDALAAFDEEQEAALKRVLGGAPLAACRARAATGAADGGLGLRRATAVAPRAFIASRVEARPLVAAPRGGGLQAALARAVAAHVDEGPQSAFAIWCGMLPRNLAARAQCVSVQRVARAFDEAFGGPARPRAEATDWSAAVAPAGSGDPEFGDISAHRHQTQLCAIADDALLDEVVASSERRGSGPPCASWRSCGSAAQITLKLWQLHPARWLRPGEFATAVRVRLGAPIAEGVAVGALRGAEMDSEGQRALCCAEGASTRGRNKIRDAAHSLASLADGAACAEPLGLGCCEGMRREKLARCSTYLPELEREGVSYRPLIWSCRGQPRPETSAFPSTMASAAARRQGFAMGEPLPRQARGAIAVQLWRRAARVVHACLPRLCAREAAAALARGRAAVPAEELGRAADFDAVADDDAVDRYFWRTRDK